MTVPLRWVVYAVGALSLAALPACSRQSPPREATTVPPAAADAVGGIDAGEPAETADTAETADDGAGTADDAVAVAEATVYANVATAEAYTQLATPLICERAIRCGTIGESQREDCLLGEGRSRLNLVWGFRDLLGIPELERQGRLAFEPSRTGECLTVLQTAHCNTAYHEAPPGCLAGPVPAYDVAAVAPGEPCTRWDECKDGFCSASGLCTGKCIAFAARGESCGANPHPLCGEEDFCDVSVCKPRGEEGDACPGHWQACRPGLFCEGWVPENDDPEWGHPERPGVCAKPKDVGAPCATERSSDQVCRSELYCDWSQAAPVCSARLPVDAECRWLDACADGLTCAGLALGGRHPRYDRYGVVTPGRCVPWADAGDACDPSGPTTACPGSMTCDETTKTCRSTCHEGDPCDSSWCPPDSPEGSCRPHGCCGGLYCDPQSRTCRRQLPPGERCVPTEFGVEDEPCFLGRCDPRRRRCDDQCSDQSSAVTGGRSGSRRSKLTVNSASGRTGHGSRTIRFVPSSSAT
jgi:hypothetical protein